MTDRTYHIREFARLSGTTVRTLHHYDRIGLLKARRTRTGCRTYSALDLDTLEQIVALKAIGIPLATIADLRRGGPTAVAKAICMQRPVLEQKKRLLDKAIHAVMDVEGALRSNEGAGVFRRIIKAMATQDPEDWQGAYETLVQVWRARRSSFSPAVVPEIGEQWEALMKDIQATLGHDWRSQQMQELAIRWLQLLKRMYGDNVPISTQKVALRNIEKWSPSFGKWPGWSSLSQAVDALPESNLG